ncbi:hypothetical protein ACHAXR_010983 [Thalassiosira sp. AJA248-18]
MRDIPSLRILALRAVGPKGCDPEFSFGGVRARVGADGDSDSDNDVDNVKQNTATSLKSNKKGGEKNTSMPPAKPTVTSCLLRSLRDSTLPQQPYSGPKPNANDVDISHPWAVAIYPPRESVNNAPLNEAENEFGNPTEFFTLENTSNHAVVCLQLYIDALVESGRAGDRRMGIHFFREWVTAITGQEATAVVPRKKGGSSKKRKITIVNESLPLGSLSLHNFAAGSIHTFRSMERANVGSCLGTLDISGVHGLTDSILTNIICCSGSFPRLRRLSVKNCRKLTGKGIASLTKLTKLCAFDVGGCFNVHPNDIVSLVQSHPSTKRGMLTEIYASGLGWTDVALEQIVDATTGHLRGLGVGFSPYISGPAFILTLSKLASTLDRLSIPFCPGMDDAAAAALCKKLPKLAVLDIRGCNKVYSLSAIMEGRVLAGNGAEKARHLFVLARYSGISNNSLEETMRLYDSESLTCILDGGGIGGGVRR